MGISSTNAELFLLSLKWGLLFMTGGWSGAFTPVPRRLNRLKMFEKYYQGISWNIPSCAIF